MKGLGASAATHNRNLPSSFHGLMKLLLWLILLILCWPIAVGLLILYPLFWLVLLPFRILGFAVEGVLQFIKALFMLPSRLLS